MSFGNVLYLLMCIGMFTLFALVLGYYSWQQSHHGGDFGTAPAQPDIKPVSSSAEAHA